MNEWLEKRLSRSNSVWRKRFSYCERAFSAFRCSRNFPNAPFAWYFNTLYLTGSSRVNLCHDKTLQESYPRVTSTAYKKCFRSLWDATRNLGMGWTWSFHPNPLPLSYSLLALSLSFFLSLFLNTSNTDGRTTRNRKTNDNIVVVVFVISLENISRSSPR